MPLHFQQNAILKTVLLVKRRCNGPAIIAGADGASVFVMNDGVLMMPPTWSMDAHDKDFSDDLRSKVDMNDGDVLVISGAKDMDQAAVSAIAAGLEML